MPESAAYSVGAIGPVSICESRSTVNTQLGGLGMEQGKPLISVIVPVYQAERFLDECISSIVHQSYKELEILLIDDGSSDSSPEICDNWAKEDDRIRVIHQRNAGVAHARNTGLDEACGDLVTFVDADDWLGTDAYRTMLDNMQRECAEISCIGIADVRGSRITPRSEPGTCAVGGAEEGLILVNASPAGEAPCLSRSVWDKLYLRRLFEGIRFSAKSYIEDAVVTYALMERVRRFVYDPRPLYFYRHVEDSRSNSDVVDLETSDYFEGLYQHLRDAHPKVAPYLLYTYLENAVRTYQASLRVSDRWRYKPLRHHLRLLVRRYHMVVEEQVSSAVIPIGMMIKIRWRMLVFLPGLYNILYWFYRLFIYRHAIRQRH